MTTNRVYFCEQSESMRNSITAYFKDKEEFEIKVCGDAESYKKAISEINPDAVVIDLEFDRARELCAALKGTRTKIMLTSRKMAEEIAGETMNFSHDAIIYKPYSLNDVRAELNNLLTAGTEKIKMTGSRNLDEKLSNIFIRAGIPPHIKGYQYLRVAVKLAINQPEIVNSITKKLYPTVAEYFNTTASKVERAIRHAIEVAWSRGKIENINAIFGIKIYGKSDKPTNGELIALVADKMVIEMMPD